MTGLRDASTEVIVEFSNSVLIFRTVRTIVLSYLPDNSFRKGRLPAPWFPLHPQKIRACIFAPLNIFLVNRKPFSSVHRLYVCLSRIPLLEERCPETFCCPWLENFRLFEQHHSFECGGRSESVRWYTYS
jgi:hypothetical protein